MLRIREILDFPNSDGEWNCYLSYEDALAEVGGVDFTIKGGRLTTNGEPWTSPGYFWERSSSA